MDHFEIASRELEGGYLQVIVFSKGRIFEFESKDGRVHYGSLEQLSLEKSWWWAAQPQNSSESLFKKASRMGIHFSAIGPIYRITNLPEALDERTVSEWIKNVGVFLIL